MKNYLISIVSVVILVGFGYLVQSQRTEIRSLKEQIAAYESGEGTIARAEIQDEAGAVRETVVEKAIVKEAASVEQSSEIADDASSQRMMRNMSEMMKNPAMNKMMVASQKGALEAMYEDLVDYLVLDEKEKKYFIDLLLTRQMARVEAGMKLMGGNLSAEDRKALQEQMKEAGKTTREEMEYFLNSEEDISEWKFYEKTMAERMAISGLEQALAQAEIPLSEGVDRKLIEVMQDEKENFEFSTDLNDEEKMDTSAERFSEDNLKKFKQDIEDLDSLIAERVVELMSTPQFEQFLKSQEQMRQMKLSQLQMAAQMFARKKE